jgi:hypothetical protein
MPGLPNTFGEYDESPRGNGGKVLGNLQSLGLLNILWDAVDYSQYIKALVDAPGFKPRGGLLLIPDACHQRV